MLVRERVTGHGSGPEIVRNRSVPSKGERRREARSSSSWMGSPSTPSSMLLNYRPKGYFGAGSAEASPPAREAQSGIHRLAVHKDSLVTQPAGGIDTIADVVDHAVEGGDGLEAMCSMCMRKRRSEYKYLNYIESKEAVSEAPRGLVELGIQKEAVMDMFAETSIALNTLQAQLADNIACVCVNLDDDGYSVRYTRRIRSREFPPSHLVSPSSPTPACSPCSSRLSLRPLPSTSSSTMALRLLPSLNSLRSASDTPIRAIHVDNLRFPAATSQRALSLTAQGCLTHGNLVALH
ncbi:hypothetical protein BJ912DRAFT_1088396 [Pholiota molesta]|nr:hypothetical protein BJ912DRAFT_1088396 [Pholiota molesta]